MSIIVHDPGSCPLCGASEFEVFARVKTPYLDHSEAYEIVTCKACGHGRALGRQDPAYLSEIYSGSFFTSTQQATSDPNAPINLNARVRAAALARKASGQLLDVGAGNGAFLVSAREHFDVEGVEYSSDAAARARAAGLSIHVGDFAVLDLPKAHYDVISLWDVLASLHDPVQAVHKCQELLKPGGLLVLTLPIVSAPIARLSRGAWPLLIPPVNLHYFTPRSAEHLARKGGFEIEEVRYDSKKVSLRFLAQKGARSLGLFAAAERLARFVPVWPVSVNTRDIATLVLRKPVETAA